jgi:hypothetical protein
MELPQGVFRHTFDYTATWPRLRVCFHVAGDRRASGEYRIAVAGPVAVGTTETKFCCSAVLLLLAQSGHWRQCYGSDQYLQQLRACRASYGVGRAGDRAHLGVARNEQAKCNFVLVQDSAAQCNDRLGRRGEARGPALTK